VSGSVETPPRAWGRHDEVDSVKYADGNTPTSVGKTPSGEVEDGRQNGNTPTSVGKTCGKLRYRGLARKHPHERGED